VLLDLQDTGEHLQAPQNDSADRAAFATARRHGAAGGALERGAPTFSAVANDGRAAGSPTQQERMTSA